jgi:hypothetical protein
MVDNTDKPDDTAHIQLLQAKKGQILDLVKNGTDIEQAIILTEVPLDMQKELSEDPIFMDCVKFAHASRIQELVGMLMDIAKANSKKGVSLEIRYLLEHMDAEHWGSQNKNSGAPRDKDDQIDENNRGI